MEHESRYVLQVTYFTTYFIGITEIVFSCPAILASVHAAMHCNRNITQSPILTKQFYFLAAYFYLPTNSPRNPIRLQLNFFHIIYLHKNGTRHQLISQIRRAAARSFMRMSVSRTLLLLVASAFRATMAFFFVHLFRFIRLAFVLALVRLANRLAGRRRVVGPEISGRVVVPRPLVFLLLVMFLVLIPVRVAAV